MRGGGHSSSATEHHVPQNTDLMQTHTRPPAHTHRHTRVTCLYMPLGGRSCFLCGVTTRDGRTSEWKRKRPLPSHTHTCARCRRAQDICRGVESDTHYLTAHQTQTPQLVAEFPTCFFICNFFFMRLSNATADFSQRDSLCICVFATLKPQFSLLSFTK